MSERFPTRRGDHAGLNCGDLVVDRADPRHLGRVDAIINSHLAKVRWGKTGWVSHVPVCKLRKVVAGPMESER